MDIWQVIMSVTRFHPIKLFYQWHYSLLLVGINQKCVEKYCMGIWSSNLYCTNSHNSNCVFRKQRRRDSVSHFHHQVPIHNVCNLMTYINFLQFTEKVRWMLPQTIDIKQVVTPCHFAFNLTVYFADGQERP